MYNFSTVSLSGSYIWINQQKSNDVMIFSDFRTPHTKKNQQQQIHPLFLFFSSFFGILEFGIYLLQDEKNRITTKKISRRFISFYIWGKILYAKIATFLNNNVAGPMRDQRKSKRGKTIASHQCEIFFYHRSSREEKFRS